MQHYAYHAASLLLSVCRTVDCFFFLPVVSALNPELTVVSRTYILLRLFAHFCLMHRAFETSDVPLRYSTLHIRFGSASADEQAYPNAACPTGLVLFFLYGHAEAFV